MANCLYLVAYLLICGIVNRTNAIPHEDQEGEVDDLKDLLNTFMQNMLSLNELVTDLAHSVAKLTLSFSETKAQSDLKTSALTIEIENMKIEMSKMSGQRKFEESGEKKAPLDGDWSEWYGNWSDCSTKCGGGTRIRTRTCTNPAPANGGVDCKGEASETQQCNPAPCPVDGGWSEYEEWSNCTVRCGKGSQTHRRSCSDPPPSNGGSDCVGALTEVRSCDNKDCTPTAVVPGTDFINKLIAACALEEKFFNGADLFHRVYSNMRDCAKDCFITDNCKSISYRLSDRQCFFKSMSGGAYGPTNSASYISMNMECNREPADLSCLREGLNFQGADLRNLLVSDPGECTVLCRDTEDCKSFTYRESDKRCYLKSKRGGLYGPMVKVGHNSMNMVCDNTAVTNLGCLRRGFNFYGNDLRYLTVADEEECVKHCRDTEGCVSLTLRESDKRCFLKSKRGGTAGPSVAEGHNSMNMQCDNSAVTNLDCLKESINFVVGDLRSLIVNDTEECVKHCRDTDECVSLTFRESDKRCYLKYMRGGALGPTIAVGYNSMNMVCNYTAVNSLNCLRRGFNFPGADIRSNIVADKEECVKLCQDTEICTAVTFRESDRRCYLKSKRGGDVGPTVALGYSSMNMECDNSPVTNLGCLRKGINFPGEDLGHLIVADEKECVKHCRDTEECTSLTFRESDQQCFLKSKRGGSVGPTALVGHNSMNMECDDSVLDNRACLRMGFNFPGADIRNLLVADEEECIKHCSDTETCVSFTFRESDYQCLLKSRRGGAFGPTAEVGYNSMNMDCDNTNVTNLNCLREGFNFPGADLRILTVADEEECVKHCRDTEDCKGFTMRESDRRCFLKSMRGGASGPTAEDGYSSLNMECDNSAVDLSCAKEDEEFPGHDIISIALDDLETCVRMCRDVQNCRSVTYVAVKKMCHLKGKDFKWQEGRSRANVKSTNLTC